MAEGGGGGVNMSDLTILEGDCCNRIREISDSSVHCVVTSPPYDDLRAYGGHPWNFEEIACQIYRVLCVGGVLCWNVGDSVIDGSETLTSLRQAIHFKDAVGFNVHDTMIYEKTNFGNPSHNRYHQMFEYVFIFSKGRPRVFNPIKDKRNAYAGAGTFGKNTFREADGTSGERTRNIIAEFGMRGNVWRGVTRGQEDCCQGAEHPAMMPNWLAKDLILSWSNPGDLIADPFAGSGTTGVAALELGRRTVLIEANPEYITLIRRQTHVTKGLALT